MPTIIINKRNKFEASAFSMSPFEAWKWIVCYFYWVYRYAFLLLVWLRTIPDHLVICNVYCALQKTRFFTTEGTRHEKYACQTMETKSKQRTTFQPICAGIVKWIHMYFVVVRCHFPFYLSFLLCVLCILAHTQRFCFKPGTRCGTT